jgi:hypothetical protein
MRLPLKFLPRQGALIGEVVGAGIMVVIALDFLGQYASPADLHRYKSIGDWLHSSPILIPFLLGSFALFLTGLGWCTIALLNLLGGSPFNYFIVDRHGITYRNLMGEQRYSWKDLGPIQSHKVSIWQGRGSQRRLWIQADTLGTEAGGGSSTYDLPSSTGSLRIPSTVYLGSNWLVGSLALSTDTAAGWLEELRQLVRIGRLEPDDIPDPPECFRTPIEIVYDDQPEDSAPDPVAAHLAKRSGDPTIER